MKKTAMAAIIYLILFNVILVSHRYYTYLTLYYIFKQELNINVNYILIVQSNKQIIIPQKMAILQNIKEIIARFKPSM